MYSYSPGTIAVVLTKGTNSTCTLGTKDRISNVIANAFCCIESPFLYIIPTVCIFPEEEVNRMLLFILNLGHNEVKFIEGYTLAYLIPSQYENFSDTEETNQEGEIANISATISDTKASILLAIPSDGKMIFPCNHTPVRKVSLLNINSGLEKRRLRKGRN